MIRSFFFPSFFFQSVHHCEIINTLNVARRSRNRRLSNYVSGRRARELLLLIHSAQAIESSRAARGRDTPSSVPNRNSIKPLSAGRPVEQPKSLRLSLKYFSRDATRVPQVYGPDKISNSRGSVKSLAEIDTPQQECNMSQKREDQIVVSTLSKKKKKKSRHHSHRGFRECRLCPIKTGEGRGCE